MTQSEANKKIDILLLGLTLIMFFWVVDKTRSQKENDGNQAETKGPGFGSAWVFTGSLAHLGNEPWHISLRKTSGPVGTSHFPKAAAWIP